MGSGARMVTRVHASDRCGLPGTRLQSVHGVIHRHRNQSHRVSMATPVFWIVSPVYQLMNELFPAEWFPTIMTEIFLRGFRSGGFSWINGLSEIPCRLIAWQRNWIMPSAGSRAFARCGSICVAGHEHAR
jgi:hypothetical protein